MLIQNQFNRVFHKLRGLLNIYSKLSYNKLAELDAVEYFETMEHYRKPPADEQEWKKAESGAKWGQTLGTAWFKTSLKIPSEWNGMELFLHSRTGAPENMVFIDGIPRGILNNASDPLHEAHYALPIVYTAQTGDTVEIAVEAYAGAPCMGCAPFENYGRDPKTIYDHVHTYEGLEIHEQRKDVMDFTIMLHIILNLYENTKDDFVKADLMCCIEEVNKIICEYPCESAESEWRPLLAKAVEVIKAALSDETGMQNHVISLIGHSHMDTAWLWPVRETKRKCARTYSNALTMMDVFPEYTFTQSSSLHTEWMRVYYPDIFEGIKKRVAENRYECNGGVWVECDCNITGGEAMIRQFLYGQKFTMEHFGKKSDCFWLPDTFGYNANIPQIMQGCDVKYFLTTKIGWNDTNSFPINTFYWKGIDGSRVLTNFNVIGGPATPFSVIRKQSDILDKRVTDQGLVSYGMGDGGGGPSFEIIDTACKIKNVTGMPKTKHTTVSEYMQNLEKTANNPPEYDGELYLELHRGTLTSKHQIKRNNRIAEIALHDFELFNSMEMASCGAKRNEEIESLYKRLLINQFHDILPGSSITEVHDLAVEEVDALISDIAKASEKHTEKLVDSNSDSLTVFNTLSWERKGQFSIEAKDGFEAFENVESQSYVDILGRKKTAISGVNIAPLAGVVLKKSENGKNSDKKAFVYDGTKLVTPFAEIEFDDNGYISSFLDKTAKRNLAKQGGYPLNAFICAEDVPHSWDNWDVDGDVEDKYVLQDDFIRREVISNGSLQIRFRSEWKIGKASRIVQDMVCFSDSPRIDFETVIYWEEKHVFLKTAFETNIRATEAKNEIQYGYITRPTTRNDSVEAAKFEVCNHKWTDISESRYGVSMLNDCKYGISQKGGSLFLSLHKAGTRPDYNGDSGVHEVTYSFLPHNCGFSVPAVVMPAYELNYPVRTVSGELSCGNTPLFEIGCDHVIIEAIKPSEDGKAIVIRLYEAEGSAISEMCLKLGCSFKKAELTNMLEEKKSELDIKGNIIELDFNAFEIKTIKFYI